MRNVEADSDGPATASSGIVRRNHHIGALAFRAPNVHKEGVTLARRSRPNDGSTLRS